MAQLVREQFSEKKGATQIFGSNSSSKRDISCKDSQDGMSLVYLGNRERAKVAVDTLV